MLCSVITVMLIINIYLVMFGLIMRCQITLLSSYVVTQVTVIHVWIACEMSYWPVE